MTDTKIPFEFGKSQMLTSERMLKKPGVAKSVYSVFGYTNIGNWARANIVVKLFNLLPFRKFDKVLDLGAGLGEFSFMIADALPDLAITAVEILPERVDSLKKAKAAGGYKNVSIFESKIEELDADGVYDLVFAVDVFEHIPENEMPFAAAYKKLKPGGFLLIKIPNLINKTIMPESLFEDHQEWLEHEHVGQVYDLDGLTNRFLKEGFTIYHRSYSDGWFSRLGWEIGFLSKKGGSAVQLLFIPLCKMLVHIDRKTFKSVVHGNAIQVIGQKPL